MSGTNSAVKKLTKRSAAMKRRWQDPEALRQHAAKMKAIWADPDRRARLAAKLRGRPISSAHRQNLSTAMRGKKHVNGRGTCSLCGREGMLHRDHCHKTGKQRGKICSRCNTAIGLLADDPVLCRKVADYLEAA